MCAVAHSLGNTVYTCEIRHIKGRRENPLQSRTERKHRIKGQSLLDINTQPALKIGSVPLAQTTNAINLNATIQNAETLQ